MVGGRKIVHTALYLPIKHETILKQTFESLFTFINSNLKLLKNLLAYCENNRESA